MPTTPISTAEYKRPQNLIKPYAPLANTVTLKGYFLQLHQIRRLSSVLHESNTPRDCARSVVVFCSLLVMVALCFYLYIFFNIYLFISFSFCLYFSSSFFCYRLRQVLYLTITKCNNESQRDSTVLPPGDSKITSNSSSWDFILALKCNGIIVRWFFASFSVTMSSPQLLIYRPFSVFWTEIGTHAHQNIYTHPFPCSNF